MILDNLEENDENHRTFHDLPNTHVLITTRYSNWGERYAQVSLTQFDESNGIIYFTHDADDKKRSFEIDEAKYLTRVVDGLPLAMQQAKLYLKDAERTSVADYVTEIETLIKEYVPPRGEQRSKREDNEHLVLAVLQKSLNQIARRSPSSAAIATFAAFFGSEKIPLRIFRQSPSTYRADLQPVLGDKESLNLRSALENPRFFEQGIGALSNFSIIKDNREDDTFSMHRVMQMAFRDSLGSSSRDWNEAALEVAGSILTPRPGLSPHSSAFDLRREVASHAQAACERLTSHEQSFSPQANKVVQHVKEILDNVSVEHALVQTALRALNTLPAAQREIMMLFYMGQVPLEPIAEKMQLTPEEASNLHRNALTAVTAFINQSSSVKYNTFSSSEHIETYLNTQELKEELSQSDLQLFERIRSLPWPHKDTMLLLNDEEYRNGVLNRLEIQNEENVYGTIAKIINTTEEHVREIHQEAELALSQ